MNIRNRWLCMGLLAAAACTKGSTDDGKGKAELGTNVATSIDAVTTAAGGSWTEVRTVESAHPYTNDLTDDITVRGAASTTEMRVVFDRFELESGYDYLSITGGGEETRHTGTKTGQEVLVSGNRVVLRFTTDYSVAKWGYRVRVFRREACTCTEQYQPVCGADGQSYDNRCFATCAGVGVAHDGTCRNVSWSRVPLGLVSDHPYTNDFNYTWTITEAGASNIRVHFDAIDTERGYDFVRVLDGNDRVVATYTGADTDIMSPDVPGDTVRIQLQSDYSIARFGFAIDFYEATPSCVVDADCGAGRVCQQVQCIRAPCFAICQAGTTGTNYTDVTIDQLTASPGNYNGQDIRVTAEPAGVARCTRRGCSAADPCCNTCSMNFLLGNSVEIRDDRGQPYGCSGDECSWRGSCRAFQPESNGRYTFQGRFSMDQFGGRSLTIDTLVAADCQHRGCSRQVCSNNPNVITTCEARPEYACYGAAQCEPQRGGHCGFTQTPDLQMCIANAGNTGGQTLSASGMPAAIPDNNPSGVTSSVIARGGASISSVRLSLNITHTYRGDLVVTLVSPSGTIHIVHNKTGGSADDVIVQDLAISSFNGESMSGTWSLRAVDTAGLDTGAIENWSLVLR